MKKVEGAKWEAQRPADRSEAAQAERMSLLERDRIALAKAVNELEIAVQREDSTRDQLNSRISSVKQQHAAVEASRSSLSDDKLRSAVYRDLGVTWVFDDPQAPRSLHQLQHHPIKCRIISRRSNDIYSLVFLPGSNAYDDSHQIWDHLGK